MDKDIAVINAKLDSITSDVSEIKSDVKDLRNNSVSRRELEEVKGSVRQKVSKKEFETVRVLVFSFVGIILVAFIGALVSLVFIK
jgi:nitrate reductase NapE component